MSDLILMHGENGKTFFVDKDEYLTHWEWKKPTKYIDKYEKNGKTVYVYENDYKDTKGVNDTQHYVRAKTGPTYTKDIHQFIKALNSKNKGYENVHSIDLRDNTRKVSKSDRSSVVDDLGTNRYLEYGYKTRIHDNNKDMYKDDIYVDARTGKEISALKVNAYATINQIKDSALQKIASTWLGKKYGIEGIKDYTRYDKYTYDGGMEKADAEEEHVDNYSKIIKEYNKQRDRAYELHDKRVESGKVKADEYDPELEKDLNNAKAIYTYRDTKEQKRYQEELENIRQNTNKRSTKNYNKSTTSDKEADTKDRSQERASAEKYELEKEKVRNDKFLSKKVEDSQNEAYYAARSIRNVIDNSVSDFSKKVLGVDISTPDGRRWYDSKNDNYSELDDAIADFLGITEYYDKYHHIRDKYDKDADIGKIVYDHNPDTDTFTVKDNSGKVLEELDLSPIQNRSTESIDPEYLKSYIENKIGKKITLK